jgi:hypothetical protein
MQFLDADDMLLPEKIARCVAKFEAEPAAGLVYTDYEIRTPDMQAENRLAEKPVIPLNDADLLRQLIESTSTPFRVPCPLVRTEAVREVGGFTPGFDAVADWHFWIKLAAAGVIFREVPEILVWYRDTPTSMSKNAVRMARERLGAMQALRGLSLPPDIGLEEKIAGRHHALALDLWWFAGDVAGARRELRAALQTHPSGAAARRMLLAMSYLLPAPMANALIQGAARLKHTVKSL